MIKHYNLLHTTFVGNYGNTSVNINFLTVHLNRCCGLISENTPGINVLSGLLIVALAIATITTVGLTIYISKQKSDGCHSPSSSRVRGRGGGEPPQSLQQQSKQVLNIAHTWKQIV